MRRTPNRPAVDDSHGISDAARLFRAGGLMLLANSVLATCLLALAWGAGSMGADEARPARGATGLMSVTSQVVEMTQDDSLEPQQTAVEEVEAATPRHEGPTFDGRPLRPARKMDMTVTAYSPDEQSCGEWADGWTASGYSVWTNGMKLVAADTSILPFGSVVTIPGYNNGQPVQVLDRGGAIKGNRLDVLYPTHQRALQWGVQHLEVTVWEYAD